MTADRLNLHALLIRVVTVGLGAAFFLKQAGGQALFTSAAARGALLASPADWIGLLAPACFLFALWAASNVFVRIGRGDSFGPAVVRGLREIGAGLMLGAFALIVLQPSLVHLIGNGFLEMRGVEFGYSVESLTLALIGLVLILLARQGEQLRSSLDQFV